MYVCIHNLLVRIFFLPEWRSWIGLLCHVDRISLLNHPKLIAGGLLIHPDWPRFWISHKVGGCQNSDGRNTCRTQERTLRWKWQGFAKVGISHAEVITPKCHSNLLNDYLELQSPQPFFAPSRLRHSHWGITELLWHLQSKVSMNFQSAWCDLNWDDDFVFSIFRLWKNWPPSFSTVQWLLDFPHVGMSSTAFLFLLIHLVSGHFSCHLGWHPWTAAGQYSSGILSKKKRSFPWHCVHLKHS